MNQLQVACLRSHLTQHFYQAKGYTASPMHRKARRLVEYQQPIIFKQDGVFQPLYQDVTGPGSSLFLGDTDWRNPNHIASQQFVIRLAPGFINTHLALAEDVVYP